MKILIFAHWNCISKDESHYLPATHISYLDYLIENGNEVTVACIIKKKQNEKNGHVKASSKIKFIALPNYDSYFDAYLKIGAFLKTALEIFKNNTFDLTYVRAPDPLAWLLVFIASKNSRTNLHFVGDSIDATLAAKGNLAPRLMKCLLYLPEYFLLILSARIFASKVFANGPHLARRLKNHGAKQTEMVISSTVSENCLSPLDSIKKNTGTLKFIYVGYLRPAKGIESLINAFENLTKSNSNVELNIIGDGELRSKIETIIENSSLLKYRVKLHGHIDDKVKLKNLLRNHDFFCFFSQSEGSPRVVIEAMAEGLPVIATKVGSLPYCFNDKDEIIFTSSFSTNAIYEALLTAKNLSSNERENIRKAAFDKVKNNYLKEKFLDRIFS